MHLLSASMSPDEFSEAQISPVPVSEPSPALPDVTADGAAHAELSLPCCCRYDMTVAVSVLLSIPFLMTCGTSLPPSLAIER